MQPTDSPRDPVNALAPKEPGAPAADDHGRMGPPPPEVIARGYEADTYENGTVLSVPLLVILFFVLAFGTVTVIFYFIAPTRNDPRAHPGAVDRTRRPLNERLAAIGNDERNKQTRDQPRLEPLKLRSGDARAITRPELTEGNSPELHPEDLRLTKERFPSLYQSGDGRHAFDQVPGLNEEALKALFPVQQNGTKPIPSQHRPSASNAGRGAEESLVIMPVAPKPEPKKAEDKKPDPKPEGKKPEDKKPAEPPKKPEDKKPEGKKPEDKKPDPKPGEKK